MNEYVGMYRHNKTGNMYTALGIVINTTNHAQDTTMVLYTNADGYKFVREINEFNEKFTMVNNVDSNT